MPGNALAPLWGEWAMSARDVAPRWRPYWKDLYGFVPANRFAPKRTTLYQPGKAPHVQDQGTVTLSTVPSMRGMALRADGTDTGAVGWTTGFGGSVHPGSAFSVLMVANIRRTTPAHTTDSHVGVFDSSTALWYLATRSVTPNGVYLRNVTSAAENVYTGCGTTGVHAIGGTSTSATSGGVIAGFCDGVKGGSTTLTGTRSGHANGDQLYVGGVVVGNTGDADHVWSAIWSVPLSDAMMVTLTANPFAPFRKTRTLVGWAPTNVSVAVTGNAATGAVGTLSWLWGVLSGAVGTGAVGSIAIQLITGPSGVAGSSAVGTFTATVITPLASVAGSTSIGTLSPLAISLLTGNAATGSVGNFGLLWGVLTGVQGSGGIGTAGPVVSFTPSGAGATGAVSGLTAALLLPLSGVSATGTIGLLIPQTQTLIILTGVGGTGAIGTFLIAGSHLLGGVRAVMSSGSRYSGTPSSFEGAP